jgi:AdoMet-dependent rRNA methyltransferase SPB1
VGTSWLHDAFQQAQLVLHSLKLATQFLAKNGTFVTKVFRSKDYNKLLWVFHQLFDRVEATKPAASRAVSAEIFVVCMGYKKPDKIDPKLLDLKNVFKELEDTSKNQASMMNDLMHPEKRKRHRAGYADGDYTLFNTADAWDFISSEDYVTVLSSANKLEFTKTEESQK